MSTGAEAATAASEPSPEAMERARPGVHSDMRSLGRCNDPRMDRPHSRICDDATANVARAIDAAVADERERCALICDSAATAAWESAEENESNADDEGAGKAEARAMLAEDLARGIRAASTT